jgi:hypothetical protein
MIRTFTIWDLLYRSPRKLFLVVPTGFQAGRGVCCEYHLRGACGKVQHSAVKI